MYKEVVDAHEVLYSTDVLQMCTRGPSIATPSYPSRRYSPCFPSPSRHSQLGNTSQNATAVIPRSNSSSYPINQILTSLPATTLPMTMLRLLG